MSIKKAEDLIQKLESIYPEVDEKDLKRVMKKVLHLIAIHQRRYNATLVLAKTKKGQHIKFSTFATWKKFKAWKKYLRMIKKTRDENDSK